MALQGKPTQPRNRERGYHCDQGAMTFGVFRQQPPLKSDGVKERSVTRDTFAHFIYRLVGARGFPPRADTLPKPPNHPVA